MKEKNKLIIAILTVAIIIGAVVGATYAWWLWTTNTAQQTTVNFTVDPGLTASIDGGTITVTKLAPVTSCTNGTYATKAPITLNYSNKSGATAVVKGTLTVTTFTVASGRNSFRTGTDPDLSHLHYALTTSNSSCTTGAISGATGTFNGKNTTGSKLIDDATLKSGITTGTTNGTQSLYLYVWLDKDYTFTNVGTGNSTIKDPMQDLTIVLTWSGRITNQQ